jgi:chromosome segregation ATPase
MEALSEFLGGDGEHQSRSFNSALSATSAISGSSSSKAVLAALRALQDKIRRLEAERSQALDESAQLRLQLKNQEIEYEHVKQREQLSAQKSLHEAKSSNERLLHEKNEMEMKLLKLEERTQQLNHSSDELLVKIRMLEEDKHAGILKIKELEHQQSKIEQQIAIAQQKEKGKCSPIQRLLYHLLNGITLQYNDTIRYGPILSVGEQTP